MRRAVYPGSFDPVTLGHLDVVRRARSIFDEVVVAVIENPRKSPLFTLSERVRLLRESLDEAGVEAEVKPFSGLLVDFLKEVDARIIVRGLRFVSDFEYEFQMALMNAALADCGGEVPGAETVFLVTSPERTYLSSSLVKEVAGLGRDVSRFVPPNVREALVARLAGTASGQGRASGEENA